MPHRRWLQLHLSTAVALMFAAGGIIWANTIDRKVINRYGVTAESFEETSETVPGDPVTKCYGWPCTAASQLVGVNCPNYPDYYYSIPCPIRFDQSSIAANAATALAILFAIWIVCEWWIAKNVGAK